MLLITNIQEISYFLSFHTNFMLFTAFFDVFFFYWILDLGPSGLTGLEAVAFAFTRWCSDLLNYNPKKIT